MFTSLAVCFVLLASTQAWIQLDFTLSSNRVFSRSSLNVSWQFSGSEFEYASFALMAAGQSQSRLYLATSVPLSQLSVSLSLSKSIKPGAYWIGVIDASKDVIGSGPGTEATHLTSNASFLLVPEQCFGVFFMFCSGCLSSFEAEHSDCHATEYCDTSNECWHCSQCNQHFDAIDKLCPAECGGNTLSLGQAWPTSSEADAVGPVLTLHTAACTFDGQLEHLNHENMWFANTTNMRWVDMSCYALCLLMLAS